MPSAFGRFLREFRTDRSLSQGELAAKLGVKSATLCDLERGRRTPSPERVQRIAAVLNVAERPLLEMALSDLLRRRRCLYRVVLEPVASAKQTTGADDRR
ncbi:helix-turn-helix transcriptional regulator [Oligoflexus tunisiensis]|uniref:helix-turn-helix transcriptional regulator n=1 Tax=Oligoflexus tunisiensis TaxID=708132 RepID=UPI001C401BD2